MVMTDTRVLMIHKHDLDVKTPFCAVNPKVKTNGYDLNENKSLGEIEMGKQTWVMKEVDNFPSYDRVIPRSREYQIETTDLKPLGLDTLYKLSYDKSIVFNYVDMAPFMKHLNKIEFSSYSFRDKDHPVMLENEDLKVIIMPMVFKDAGWN